MDTAANEAGVAVENNSLGVAVKAVKVAGKVIKVALKKGRVTPGDLKKIIQDSGLEIVSDVLTISDGQLTFDDAKAIIDIVVGTNLNNKQVSRAAINRIINNRARADLAALNRLKQKYRNADAKPVKKAGRTQSSAVLSENLQASGIDRPAGTQAHHIVGQSTQVGKETQALLKKFGIDINSSANGVFLPGCGSSNATGMVHCGRHTTAYEQAVWIELQGVRTKQQAIARLQIIRDQLLENKFTPLNIRSTR